MKIWTLVENTACAPEYRQEHGLSLYMETGDKKILFDAGQSDAFWENAEKLGIDLTRVDFAVLSHGHYDHGGGLDTFLQRNAKAPVYVSRYAFGAHYNGAGKYIGLDPSLLRSGRLIPVERDHVLAPGITLLSCNHLSGSQPIRPEGLKRLEGSGFIPEDFLHEQYLLIEEKGKRILFSGCSHKGIENIAAWIPSDVLVGGFHFMKRDPADPLLLNAARWLRELGGSYYTGHCTGVAQYEVMKSVLGERLQYLSAGTVVEV